MEVDSDPIFGPESYMYIYSHVSLNDMDMF